MTVATTDCSHGMPSRAACVDCMEDGPVADAPRWVQVGEPFRSVYDGTCPSVACGRPMPPGTELLRWDRTDGSRTVYTHSRCRP